MRTSFAVVSSIICTILSAACSHAAPSDPLAADPTTSADSQHLAADLAAAAPSDEHDCNGDAGSCSADTPPVGAVVENVSTTGAARGASAESAAITIVEFADYQCSYCTRAETTIHALEAAHPGQVRVVFKNMPMPMHASARLLAKAALAADGQSDFWEMHDRLFAGGGPEDRAGLVRLASELGLDTKRFARDLDDAALDAKIDADVAEAKSLGIQGTPTFFVNGRRVTGAQPLETFEKAVSLSAPPRSR